MKAIIKIWIKKHSAAHFIILFFSYIPAAKARADPPMINAAFFPLKELIFLRNQPS